MRVRPRQAHRPAVIGVAAAARGEVLRMTSSSTSSGRETQSPGSVVAHSAAALIAERGRWSTARADDGMRTAVLAEVVLAVLSR